MSRTTLLNSLLCSATCLFLAGCISTTPTPTVTQTFELLPTTTMTEPVVPEVFRTQLVRFMEEGTKLKEMTELEINYYDFQQQFISVKVPYQLSTSSWPPDFLPEGQFNLTKAFEGWDLAHYLWELKIEQEPPPCEPDLNRYDSFISYGGEFLFYKTYPKDNYYINPKCRGKIFLPFDENIMVLFELAGIYFEEGMSKVMPELQ